MKKQIILSATILLSAGILFFTGCKKDDTSGPVITLKGSETEQSILNAAYTDPGATAEDDEDGVVEVTASGKVDVNLVGAYVITYSATDAAGNTTTAKRTVTVYNEAAFLSGSYTADDTCTSSTVLPYTATITVSTKVNREFVINNFGGFGPTKTNITASISGASVGSKFSWAAQQLDAPTNILSAGTNVGSITSITSPVSFTFPYQWTGGGATEVCTSTYVHK